MRVILLGVTVALAGCGADRPLRDRPEPAPATDVGTVAPKTEISSCIESSNVIDVAACPGMIGRGCAVTPRASTGELCRRLHLDLIGVLPTRAEIASRCEGKQPAEIAKALMATPAFVRRSLEMWAETLAYE